MQCYPNSEKILNMETYCLFHGQEAGIANQELYPVLANGPLGPTLIAFENILIKNLEERND
jgi:hypothetical protein